MVGVYGPGRMRISWEAIILLYGPALDPHLQKVTELAEWVFCSARSENSSRGSQKLISRKPMI
jgi:hypothetical protein